MCTKAPLHVALVGLSLCVALVGLSACKTKTASDSGPAAAQPEEGSQATEATARAEPHVEKPPADGDKGVVGKGEELDPSISVQPLRHASFVLTWGKATIVVDPVAEALAAAGAETLAADLILVTDLHFDHLEPKTIATLRKEGAMVVAPADSAGDIPDAKVLANGESVDVLQDVVGDGAAITITAVPMYNLERTRPDSGEPFHVQGRGNGYLLTKGETTVYISGDTECIPEMKALTDIDLALVCMNLPYTMPVEEAAECVKAFKPKVVLPYHHKGQDPNAFAALMADTEGVEVRVLDWYPESEKATGE